MYLDFIQQSFQLQLGNQIQYLQTVKNYQNLSNNSSNIIDQQSQCYANDEQQQYIEKIMFIDKSHVALISNKFINIVNFQTGRFISRINCNYFWQSLRQKHQPQQQTNTSTNTNTNTNIISYFQECYYCHNIKKFITVIFFNGSRYFVSFDLNISNLVDIQIRKQEKNIKCYQEVQVLIQNICVLYSFKEFPVKYGLELQPKIIGFSETGTIVLVRKFYSDSMLVVFKYNQSSKTHENHWSFSINQECISNLDQAKYLVNYRQLIQKNYLQIQIVDVQQKFIRNLRIQEHIEPCTIYGILRPISKNTIIKEDFKNLTIIILMNIRKCKRSSILKYNTHLQLVQEYSEFENQQFQDIFRINKQFVLLTKNFWNSQKEQVLPECKIQIVNGDFNLLLTDHKNMLNNGENNNKAGFLFTYNVMRQDFVHQPTLGTFLCYHYNIDQKMIQFDAFKMIGKRQAYCHILDKICYQIQSTTLNQEQLITNKSRETFKMNENQQILKHIYQLL